MLPSIKDAFNRNGPRRKAVAAGCCVSRTQLYSWFTGRAKIPVHKRQSIDREFGASVDWSQYEAEFDAIERLEAANHVPQEDQAPNTTKTSKEAPQEPHSAPRSWFAETFLENGDADA
jgi:hypothetical protein